MKVEVTDKGQSFELFELKILVESEEDLQTLWYRFKIDIDAVLHHTNIPSKYRWFKNTLELNNSQHVWNILNDIAIKRGLR